jgi:hypothetical protein
MMKRYEEFEPVLITFLFGPVSRAYIIADR